MNDAATRSCEARSAATSRRSRMCRHGCGPMRRAGNRWRCRTCVNRSNKTRSYVPDVVIKRLPLEQEEAARRVEIYAARFEELDRLGIDVFDFAFPTTTLFGDLPPAGQTDGRHDPYELCDTCRQPKTLKCGRMSCRACEKRAQATYRMLRLLSVAVAA